LGGRELGSHVIGFETDVMQPLAAPLEELGHAAIAVDGLEQLDLALPNGEQRGLDPLVLDYGHLVDLESERVAIKAVRLLEIPHDDANVMDLAQHVIAPVSRVSLARV